MTKDKPNCYECKHRGTVVGSCHSSCLHPDARGPEGITRAGTKLGVSAKLHGIKKGWFWWPTDFDPVWLLSCSGFESKAAT